MMVARKIGKLYPLFNVLRLMKTVKPLGARQAAAFYTAPIRWLASLGRVSYYDLLPAPLVVSSRYGLFCTHARNIDLLFQEVYEVEHILPSLIDKDSVFIDVGAYQGLYTVYACKHAKKVLAVEPNPMALAYLKTNIALNNCHNTIAVPKAAGDRRGVVKLRIPRPAKKGHISTMASIVWSFEEALEIDVEADTLDNIVDDVGLDSVDFIKIDVEGAEGLVVKGAERTLRKARAILIEIWPENIWIISYLQALGYKSTKVIDHYGYKNYLFLKERASDLEVLKY
jgi:FkbM family methyltransferase